MQYEYHDTNYRYSHSNLDSFGKTRTKRAHDSQPEGLLQIGRFAHVESFCIFAASHAGTHGPDHPFLSEFRSVLVSALLMRDGLNGVRTTNRTKVSSKVVIGSEAVGKALTSIQALTSDSGGDCKVISAKSRGMAPAA